MLQSQKQTKKQDGLLSQPQEPPEAITTMQASASLSLPPFLSQASPLLVRLTSLLMHVDPTAATKAQPTQIVHARSKKGRGGEKTAHDANLVWAPPVVLHRWQDTRHIPVSPKQTQTRTHNTTHTAQHGTARHTGQDQTRQDSRRNKSENTSTRQGKAGSKGRIALCPKPPGHNFHLTKTNCNGRANPRPLLVSPFCLVPGPRNGPHVWEKPKANPSGQKKAQGGKRKTKRNRKKSRLLILRLRPTCDPLCQGRQCTVEYMHVPYPQRSSDMYEYSTVIEERGQDRPG
ncbi:hypothetical protein J3F83DRAFT_473823 [Trichoderma novae-zelandiae]